MALPEILKNRSLLKKFMGQEERVMEVSIDCATTLDAIDLNNHLNLLTEPGYVIEEPSRKGKTVNFKIHPPH